jgi:hypothetical protein
MRNEILAEAQRELSKHIWDNFVSGDENGRSIGQGGRGVVVVGCVACKKDMQTRHQYMRHLTDEVLPDIVDMVIERVGIAED